MFHNYYSYIYHSWEAMTNTQVYSVVTLRRHDKSLRALLTCNDMTLQIANKSTPSSSGRFCSLWLCLRDIDKPLLQPQQIYLLSQIVLEVIICPRPCQVLANTWRNSLYINIQNVIINYIPSFHTWNYS